MLWHKSKKLWTGFVVLVLTYGYVIYRLGQIDFSSVHDLVSTKSNWHILLFFLLQLAFLVINLSFEALKWKRIMVREIRFSFLESIKMVLAGFASGIFTPAKLGEPIGRFLFLPKTKWLAATSLSYFGGVLQSILILTLGLGASLYLFIGFSNDFLGNIVEYGGVFVILMLVSLLMMHFSKSYLKKMLHYFKWKEQVKEMYSCFSRLSKGDVTIAVFFSGIRFVVFSLQLYLLFNFLQPDLSWQLILWIFVYYLGITLFPAFILADLGIRNSVGLFLFTFIGVNELVIMSSVSILWVVNQVIPALIGGLLVFRLKRK